MNTVSKGADGFTALHYASFHGNVNLIKLFIANGADVFAKNP